MRDPERIYDRRGIRIYPGDLLKSFHFEDRRKKHYLYHVAVCTERGMDMVPTAHLEPSKIKGGGRCALSQGLADNAEIISGYGPADLLDFNDRERVDRT